MFLKRLALENILSFRKSDIELRQLNVLIGPNAVGKSNLIEAIGLLQAAPANLSQAILRGGGVRQWLWLGQPAGARIAKLECGIELSSGRHAGQLVYRLEFSEDAGGFVVAEESLSAGGAECDDPDAIYFVRNFNNAAFAPKTKLQQGGMSISPGASVLSQFKNPLDPTPITSLGQHFERIRIFREFRSGIGSGARQGVSTSAPKDSLSEGGDNLALVLHELDFQGVHDRIRAYVTRFCDRFEDVNIRVGEGLAQAFLREKGLVDRLSALRMSDGTLKFLCLLAVLFHPSPPPLICIEEPELGMHPDALQLIAEALVEASEHVQLVIATHSEALIDALSDSPEAVLVCERDFEGSTQCRRLSEKELRGWLERYTLGQLWRKGEIGGGRW